MAKRNFNMKNYISESHLDNGHSMVDTSDRIFLQSAGEAVALPNSYKIVSASDYAIANQARIDENHRTINGKFATVYMTRSCFVSSNSHQKAPQIKVIDGAGDVKVCDVNSTLPAIVPAFKMTKQNFEALKPVVENIGGYKVATFDNLRYPQAKVDYAMSHTLENWFSMNDPTPSKFYLSSQSRINSLVYDDEEKDYEYIYQGKRYVRVVAESARTNNARYTFSDGTECEPGQAYWFEVQPIRWVVLNENDENVLLRSEEAIISGLPFSTVTDKKAEIWQNSYVRSVLNGTRIKNTIKGPGRSFMLNDVDYDFSNEEKRPFISAMVFEPTAEDVAIADAGPAIPIGGNNQINVVGNTVFNGLVAQQPNQADNSAAQPQQEDDAPKQVAAAGGYRGGGYEEDGAKHVVAGGGLGAFKGKSAEEQAADNSGAPQQDNSVDSQLDNDVDNQPDNDEDNQPDSGDSQPENNGDSQPENSGEGGDAQEEPQTVAQSQPQPQVQAQPKPQVQSQPRVQPQPQIQTRQSSAQSAASQYNLTVRSVPLTIDEQLKFYKDNGFSFMLHGVSGVGKTRRVEELDPDLSIISLRVGMLPEEVLGKTAYENGVADWIPPTYFKEMWDKCTKDPDHYHILLIDELTNVKPQEQALAYNLILKSSIDGSAIQSLPKNCLVCATGNSPDESASAYLMTEPLFRRFHAHITLKPDVRSFIQWGGRQRRKDPTKLNIHPAVLGFVAQRGLPVLFTSYHDGVTDEYPRSTFAVDPRGWEQVSDVLYSGNGIVDTNLLINKIGQDLTTAFLAFLRQKRMITPFDIENNSWNRGGLPRTVDEKLALALSLTTATEDQIIKVREFIKNNIGKEYLAMFDSEWSKGNDERALLIGSLIGDNEELENI